MPIARLWALSTMALTVILAAGVLPAAGQDAARTDATVASPAAGTTVRSAPTAVVRTAAPTRDVEVRLLRDGEVLARASTGSPEDAETRTEHRVALPVRALAAVANGPALLQARTADGPGAWAGHEIVLDLDPLPTRVDAEAHPDAVEVEWAPVPLAPEGRYEVQRAVRDEGFTHVGASHDPRVTRLRDEDVAPATYSYRVVTARPGADPGVWRHAFSEPVRVTVPEPEPDVPVEAGEQSAPSTEPAPPGAPPPSPQRPVPQPESPPQSDPQPQPQPEPPPQPESQPDDAGGSPAAPSGPGAGGSAAPGRTPAPAPPDPDVGTAARPGSLPRSADTPPPPRSSGPAPRLRSGTAPAPGVDDEQLAFGDVPAPEVAPRDPARDDPMANRRRSGYAPPQDDPGEAPWPERPEAGALARAVPPPSPATLDLVRYGPPPQPETTVLVALAVFGLALLALRRRT